MWKRFNVFMHNFYPHVVNILKHRNSNITNIFGAVLLNKKIIPVGEPGKKITERNNFNKTKVLPSHFLSLYFFHIL